MLKITFRTLHPREGTFHSQTVEVESGITLLEAAHRHGIPLEGACEGALACSTCHVIVSPEWYRRLDPATEEEEDVLDLAFGVTPTSRLGCQMIVTEPLNGLEVTIPGHSTNIHLNRP